MKQELSREVDPAEVGCTGRFVGSHTSGFRGCCCYSIVKNVVRPVSTRLRRIAPGQRLFLYWRFWRRIRGGRGGYSR